MQQLQYFLFFANIKLMKNLSCCDLDKWWSNLLKFSEGAEFYPVRKRSKGIAAEHF